MTMAFKVQINPVVVQKSKELDRRVPSLPLYVRWSLFSLGIFLSIPAKSPSASRLPSGCEEVFAH